MTRAARPCLCGARTSAQSHHPTCYWHDPSYDRPIEAPAELLVFMGWHGVRMVTHDRAMADAFSAKNEGLEPVVYRRAVVECDTCHGAGEVFNHADDCDNDSCALNGDMDSCQGKVEPCPVCEDGHQ